MNPSAGCRAEVVRSVTAPAVRTRKSLRLWSAQLEEVLDDLGTLGREDAFGVELHAEAGKFAMLRGHDQTIFCPSGQFQFFGKVVALDDEGVIPPGLERVGDACKDAGAVVEHHRGLAVNWSGAPDSTAAHDAERLVAQTYAQHGHLIGQGRQKFGETPRVFGPAWSGGKDHRLRLSSDQIRRPTRRRT